MQERVFMAKKNVVKYYNFVVKVEAEGLDENRSIASNINDWIGDYMCDDSAYSDGTWSYELVKYSEVKKKRKAK